jgi:dolichol kinase
LAGLAAGFAAAIWFHVGPGPAFASALVATLVELMPTSAVVNDNFWIPVASAAVLRAFGVR